MPNWCTNEVSVYGTKEDIKSFKDLVQENDENIFSFRKIKPIPEELEGTVSGSENAKPDWQKEKSFQLKYKYGADNWYMWCINNWGTKWDACSVDIIDETEQTINYIMETAWSPPEGIVNILRKKFPELDIDWFYREDGCQISGWL